MLTISNWWKAAAAIATCSRVSVWKSSRGPVGVLIGPAGSGKSTVLRCVNGLEPFDQGSVAVGPARLSAGNHNGRAEELKLLRRRVGTVFQQFNLLPAPLGARERDRSADLRAGQAA